jgi:ribonuclease HI
VAEWTETQQSSPGHPRALEHVFQWLFHPQWGRGGVLLISPKGDQLLYVIQLHFRATNNVVEYEALINSLRIAAELGVQKLYICGDSELIINQIMGESNYCNSHMVAYQQ